MRKILILLIILQSAILAFSQTEIIVVKKNGGKVFTTLSATSKTQLFSSDGTFDNSEIDTVFFKKEYQGQKGAYDNLFNSGVVVMFSTGVFNPSVVKLFQDYSEEVDLNYVIESLNKFREQRQTGKALQIGGMLLTVVGAAITKDEPDTGPIIAAVGGGIGLVGFIIDADAGKHLKIPFSKKN